MYADCKVRNMFVPVSPSGTGKTLSELTNGWWFFLVDAQSRRSLSDVRIEYLESIAADVEEDDADDDADEDS